MSYVFKKIGVTKTGVAENKFQKKIEIDVSTFGKGIFFVKVCDKKVVKRHTEKVILE